MPYCGDRQHNSGFWRWSAGRAVGVPLPVSGMALGALVASYTRSLNEFTTLSRSADHAAKKIGKWDFPLRYIILYSSTYHTHLFVGKLCAGTKYLYHRQIV